MPRKISFPKIPLLLIRKTFFITIILSFTFSLGYIYGYKGFRTSFKKFPEVTITRQVPPEKQTLDFSLFWRVWDTLHAQYFDKDKVIPSELIYGAIKGMVAAIGDPYTAFLPPSENKIVQEDLQGNFEGVGIQIGFKGNQLAVISPLPSSPAERVDIKAGDFIIGIRDELKALDRGTVGITLPEAVQAIRGPANTKVTFILLRQGNDQPFEVQVTREKINIPSIVLGYINTNKYIAHLKILKFSGETINEWGETVIALLKNSELKGVVIDVRNNPGGILDDAVELASDFLNVGDVVVIEEDGSDQRSETRVEKLGRLKNLKLVVLINQGSASASEILAGTLRDNKNVKLVGETSFGKGTIQEAQQINGDSGLHITTARWLTPKGLWVNDGGLKPDIEIEDNEETEQDEQLDKAIELLNSEL